MFVYLRQKDSYLAAHIPTAQFFDIDAAFYPTKYKRFASYPSETFEKYAQLLGINADDHLLFYGRGNPFQTMIFPARVYWLFKVIYFLININIGI